MELLTRLSLLAVAQVSKLFTIKCRWIDTDMSKAAVVVVAPFMLEVEAGWSIMR